jgi:Fe-S-cluster-containing dehydrogenase component
MDVSRRSLLKAVAVAGASSTATALASEEARADTAAADETVGMLYDSTKCVGCKACMMACNAANDISLDTASSDGRAAMPVDLNEHALNIIKIYTEPENEGHAYIKRQCMHCVDPACVSACMIGAMRKQPNGAVTYDSSRCVGCRYCEMGCPFNVPKFEWSKVIPKIVKCQLCIHRTTKGMLPACVEVCPPKAVIYGKRSELLAEAHRRLKEHPEHYVPKVYGEHEAGGTQVLYLAGVDFEKLGLPNYNDRPIPETVHNVQHSVYQGFVLPTALYGVLAAITWRNRTRRHETSAEEEQP